MWGSVDRVAPELAEYIDNGRQTNSCQTVGAMSRPEYHDATEPVSVYAVIFADMHRHGLMEMAGLGGRWLESTSHRAPSAKPPGLKLHPFFWTVGVGSGQLQVQVLRRAGCWAASRPRLYHHRQSQLLALLNAVSSRPCASAS